METNGKATPETRAFGRVGGTAISAIVGQNPWSSPLGCYLELRREVEPKPDNAAMALGRKYEPIVADVFAAGNPIYCVEHNRAKTTEPELVVHPERSYLVGRPDRVLFDSVGSSVVAGLEIKTTNVMNYGEWGAEGTDEVPPHYLLQCQWYAGLMGLDDWKLAVAFLDGSGVMRSYREYAIIADDELFSALVERAIDFYENNVLAGVAPEYTVSDEATERWIVQRYPRNVEPIARANADEEALMEAFICAKKEADEAQATLDQATAALKMAIGDRDGLRSDALGKVTWKKSKDSTRIDYKAAFDDLVGATPEQLAKYSKSVAGTRRFDVKGLNYELV